MTDLKIILNAYATIKRKKSYRDTISYETITSVMLPDEQQLHFFIDPDTLDLEKKLVEGLSKILLLILSYRRA